MADRGTIISHPHNLKTDPGMAPLVKQRALKASQTAFDEEVQENMETFGMSKEEALLEALQAFKLRGFDVSDIASDGNGSSADEQHPVVVALSNVQSVLLNYESNLGEETRDPVAFHQELSSALDALSTQVYNSQETESHSIAGKNKGIETLVRLCKLFAARNVSLLTTSLKILHVFLRDDANKVLFRSCDGPDILLTCSVLGDATSSVAACVGSLISVAASGCEIMKEEFMILKAEERLIGFLNTHSENALVVQGACDGLRSLVTSDDPRVLASKAFGNGRKIAKAGALEAILNLAPKFKKSPSTLAVICSTLRAIAVNDEICKSAEKLGALKLVLEFLDEATSYMNITFAKSALGLLTQLSGSDANKDAIVSYGGLDKLVRTGNCYSDDPTVIQEIMTAIASLSLRSPANATKAVEAGSVDLAVEMMEKHSLAAGVQRQSCQMIRNLAVRNPENRPIIIEKGIETLIRAAKARHIGCKDAAAAALRDLGFNDYL